VLPRVPDAVERYEQRQRAQRNEYPEDPSPARSVGETSAHARPECRADVRDPEREPKRPRAGLVGVLVAQDGDTHREDDGGSGALQHAERHKHAEAWRERTSSRRDPEQRDADQQCATAPEDVPDPPGQDE
jgi:hypothetical protein